MGARGRGEGSRGLGAQVGAQWSRQGPLLSLLPQPRCVLVPCCCPLPTVRSCTISCCLVLSVGRVCCCSLFQEPPPRAGKACPGHMATDGSVRMGPHVPVTPTCMARPDTQESRFREGHHPRGGAEPDLCQCSPSSSVVWASSPPPRPCRPVSALSRSPTPPCPSGPCVLPCGPGS